MYIYYTLYNISNYILLYIVIWYISYTCIVIYILIYLWARAGSYQRPSVIKLVQTASLLGTYALG